MKIVTCNEKNKKKAAQLRNSVSDARQLQMLQRIPDYKEIQVHEKEYFGGLVKNTQIDAVRRRSLSGRVFGDMRSVQCDLMLTQFSNRYEAITATLSPHEQGLGYNLLLLDQHGQVNASVTKGTSGVVFPNTERARVQGRLQYVHYGAKNTTCDVGLGARYDRYSQRPREGLVPVESADQITLSRLPSAVFDAGLKRECSRGAANVAAEFTFSVPSIVEINTKQAELEQKKNGEEFNQTPSQSFNQTKFGLDKFIFGLRLVTDFCYKDQFINGVFWTQVRSKASLYLQSQSQIVVEPPQTVKGLFDQLQSSGKLLIRSWGVLGINLSRLFTTKQPMLKWLDFILNYANLLFVDDLVGTAKENNKMYVGVGNDTIACLWNGKQFGLAFGLLE